MQTESTLEVCMSQVLELPQSTARRQGRSRHQLVRRSCAFIAALAATLNLTACGGGGDEVPVAFEIGVVVGGHVVSGVQVVPGGSQNLSITAGQSIELDASEPVVWTLVVGGTTVTGSGTTVYYAGASITQT